jgi:hypothetical protein
MANRFNPISYNYNIGDEYVDPQFVIPKKVVDPKQLLQEKINARLKESQQRQAEERRRQERERQKIIEDALPIQKGLVKPAELTEKQKQLRDLMIYKARTREEQEKECPICLERDKDTFLKCGHAVCKECLEDLKTCPICRKEIMGMGKDIFCVIS